MKIANRQILRDFKEKHADSRSVLDSWEAEVEDAEWHTPHDLKQQFRKASLVRGQALFDICWNNYRIWTKIAYQTGVVLIKKIGTHKEYDKWDIK